MCTCIYRRMPNLFNIICLVLLMPRCRILKILMGCPDDSRLRYRVQVVFIFVFVSELLCIFVSAIHILVYHTVCSTCIKYTSCMYNCFV